MPQQINLFTPILLTQKRYFSSQAMALALLVFLVLGGALCAYGVWSLNRSSELLKRELTARSAERELLQNAIKARKSVSTPGLDAVLTELKATQAELQQREALLVDLRRGLVAPGSGHAARLRLIAQSIPTAVWITQILADDRQLEVSGFTAEPSTLNEWVARLGQSPLLEGQSLSAVKVERSQVDSTNIWSFSLLSAARAPITTASGVHP
jgi:Tfp pilus assembly protein PilN